jgi:DNA-binding CsgD family transcriptional regulator
MNTISELSLYLSRPEVTPALLAQFLVLRTLEPLGANQTFISSLHNDGMVRPLDAFGFSEEQTAGWQEYPLSAKLPITDCIKNDQLIWLADAKDWELEYPELAKYPGDVRLETFIACSIDIYGAPAAALGIMCKAKISPTPELISFVLAVSAMVALFLSRMTEGRLENPVRPEMGASGEFLSLRQMKILDLMAQDFTNPQIAKDLGFSESTIRQESMRIYQILQVTGRKEAIHEARLRNISK